ncbi:uncharacterized protein B0J16DRAFT_401780 [Fusarium flagelliforme]|uniref:uncharacterized protein n=1 Tax=Fusarium flagelliforme TaxID=2675880 RepID=UPI001E8CB72F|nr:uncharacterized protein B0J16DRAFT_401780 [Fusarium flagelliforme]KAH7183441.1 hypothetical protein B0J16DRAFT_401780 [Fusarium flagelliforme]
MATANNTIDDIVGWQSGPKDRGTVTLIWGCVTTIFACSWTILHLNVPALTDSGWTRLRRKAKWMAITILFPEFILSKAICDLRLALRELVEFDDYLRSDHNQVKWRTRYGTKWSAGEDEWSWRVEFPQHARWLYRLLFLKPPRQNAGKGLSPFSDTENEAVELNTRHNNHGEHERGQKEQQEKAEQEKVEQEIHNAQNSKTDSEQDLEASGGHGKESSPSNKSGQPQIASRPEQRTQLWTIVHSYFVQMGGLAYVNPYSERNTLDYFVLTPSKLTPRYQWSKPHPLEQLVLDRAGIEDKSKADSFVKSVAILQILWLVLNVIARAIKKLPITQIEIATIAFAVMAIFTYASNWWKPKDVSRPIRLVPRSFGVSSRSDATMDLMQSFMTRLQQPHWTLGYSRTIPDLRRVPNDWVWMEGQTPLFHHLLGISSLAFGSLHCIAWIFKFPTRTELLCWRVASVLSATLPGIALGLSMIIGYLRTVYIGRKRIPLLYHALQPLETVSEERWKHLITPKFKGWSNEAIGAFMAMPKDSNTDWEAEPSQKIIEEMRDSEIAQGGGPAYVDFIQVLQRFYEKWWRRQSVENQPPHYGEELFLECSDQVISNLEVRELGVIGNKNASRSGMFGKIL